MKEKVFFTSGSNVLAAAVYLPEKKKKNIGLLFLHGGGSAAKERYSTLQEFLAGKGYPSFAFDFQGVGESNGTFTEGTLRNRMADAVRAFEAFSNYVPTIIPVGCSMGGHVAVRLTEEKHVPGLILLYAAAYPEEAEDKPLNEAFTNSIRNNERWKGSPVFSVLRQFSGNVLILYGEHDTVIPKGVQTMYNSSVTGTRRFAVIPNAPHLLLSEEASRKAVYNEIDSFLYTI